MRRILRALLGIVSVGIKLPAVLLGVWGGFYIASCVQALTAPGVPIEYRYQSEMGEMLVRADSYQFDLETMQGYVMGVTLHGPDGTLVASVEAIDLLLDGDVAIVSLNDPYARVNRLQDGSFDILKMLPVQEEREPTGGAFRLVVDRATLEYRDVSNAEGPVHVVLKDVGVDSAEGTYLFKSAFATDTVSGSAHGTFSEDGRLIAEATLVNGELTPLLPYALPFFTRESLGEFADFRADALTAVGRAQVWTDKDKNLQVSADMQIEGRGLRTRENLRGAKLSASVKSTASGARIVADVSQPGLVAHFDGSADFSEGARVRGGLKATVASQDAVPPLLAEYLEPGLSFVNARVEGSVDSDGLFDAAVAAESAAYAGETAKDILGRLRVTPERLVARVEKASWAGVELSGAAAVDFKSGALSGGFDTERGRLEPLAQHFGTDRLQGVFGATAVLGGTLEAPHADVYARGSGGVAVTEGPLVSLGVYELRGRLDAEGLHLERLTAAGENGSLAAYGTMAWEDGALDFVVNAGGLDVSAVSEDLQGLGFMKASVSGTRDEPRADGRLEVYGFEAIERKVPQIVAEWKMDPSALDVTRLAARIGTGRIDGTARMEWDGLLLSGAFSGSGIRLEEWVTASTVGALSMNSGVLSGTWDSPLFTAKLSSDDIYAGGVEIEGLSAEVEIDREALRSPSFALTVNGGDAVGTAEYRFAEAAGRLNARFADFSLAKVPLAEYSLILDGLAGGEVVVAFAEGTVQRATLNSDVEYVTVNGTPVGQGSVFAEYFEDAVVGEVQVGSFDRYLLLSDARYDIGDKTVAGDLFVYNILVADVVEGVGKAIEAWPRELVELLESTEGLLNAGITVSGQAEDPQIDIESLTVTDLRVRGREAGEVRLAAGRQSGVWSVWPIESSPVWKLKDTEFVIEGTVTEDGYIEANGELNNLQSAWISTLFPAVPLTSGVTRKFSFAVEGPYDSPSGRGNLEAEELGYYEGEKAVKLPLSINLYAIDVAESAIELLGFVTYNGLTGDVVGTVPFSSFLDDPEGREPMDVSIQVPETSLEQMARFLPAIDGGASDGSLSGEVRVTGLWGELEVSATARASAKSLALAEHGTFFKDLNAVATLSDNALEVSADFKGESSGTGLVSLKAVFPDLLAGDVGSEEIKRLTTLDGRVVVSDYRLQFLLPNATVASGATVSTQSLTVKGTIAQPSIGGNVVLDSVFVRLPDEFASTGEPVIYSVDPAFDGLTLTVSPGARIVTDAARIDFFGTGRLAGSLQNPDIALPLTVTGGRFDMPTARVTLEEGGTIVVGYRSALSTAPVARVDLNLEGRTSINARRADNEYENYQVQLLIRGNLLDEEGLNISASSDPPDLSSEQIMAVLGRKELIENFARGGSDEYLRDTLYSVGLPTAANMLTSGLAENLGLDYIAVDYNPFDATTLGAGKSLTKGLMAHVSRQLAPNPGERLKYDVQLTYRLPMQDAFFSRVRLSLGLDELVPWRLKLNWSKRF